ncbi:GGDEF domain-containing protein [Rhizobium sp. S152]|uniref:GGDEF domain-containing protein n=1 Tax=Rhizobium sp. S152 TaxID=3055038 RepID=UPI0025A9AC2A|nr:GGDEF domain-containing protein [Rhizobium sp. S152]MDM9628356.1 GGDEF domain-containing protein [Rhizobium sp. S152]
MDSTDRFAFMLPVMMMTFGCTFLVVARFGSREAIFWSMGFLCAAAGFAVPMVLFPLPVVIQALTADLLFLAAFHGYSSALLVRFGRPPSFRLRTLFCAIAYAGLAYAVIVLQSLPAELMISDLACSALLIFAIGACLHSATQLIDRILLGVASLIVVETIVRNVVMLAIFTPQGGIDSFAGSPYAFVMQAGASVIALLFALSALGATTLDTVAQYRDAAETDSLTGLLNRRGFEDAARRLRARGALHGAVLVCDIDNFKRINDTLGHAAGDTVIAGLAQLLRARLPDRAFAARFGGEGGEKAVEEGAEPVAGIGEKEVERGECHQGAASRGGFRNGMHLISSLAALRIGLVENRDRFSASPMPGFKKIERPSCVLTDPRRSGDRDRQLDAGHFPGFRCSLKRPASIKVPAETACVSCRRG